MRLKPNEIDRLTRKMVQNLNDKKLFIPKVELTKLIHLAQELIQENLEEEVAIDQETQRMMAQYDEQIKRGEAEYHRMFQMIKNKIAKERKFVL